MTQNIERAVLELSTDDTQFNAGIDRAKGKAADLGASFKKTAKDAEDAGGTISGFFGKIVAGVASGELLAHALEKVGEGALEAVKALPELIEHTMHLGSEMVTMSLQTGISVEGLSKLRYVAAQTGVDMGTLTSSIFRMESNLGSFSQQGKLAQDAIKSLHLSITTLRNERPEEAFVQILEKLQALPNEAQRASAGMAIFGRSFKEIGQLAHENVAEIMKEAEDLGIVMTTDMAAAAKAAEDSLTALKFQIEGVGIRIGAAFLPAIIGVSGDIQHLFKAAIDDANQSLDAMGKPGSGFLATVAKAMGSGEEAIAAQTQLYFDLRDALISLVRSGIEPLVTAIGFVGKEWDAALVLANMVVVGYQGITYAIEGVLLGFAEIAKYTDPFGASKAKRNIEFLSKDLDRLYNSMAVGQQKIDDYKKSEQDWDKTTEDINKHIEAGLKGVESTHVDVAATIKKVHAMIDAATKGTREGIDGETASLDKLNQKSPEYQHAMELLALANKHLAAEAQLAAKAQEANFKAFGDFAAHAPTAILGTVRDLSGLQLPPVDVGAVQAVSAQRAILDATFDHIEMRMHEQRIYTEHELQLEADAARRDYDDIRRSGLYTSDELQSAWQRMVEAQIRASSGLKQAYLQFVSALPQQLSDAFAKMLTHAESFKEGFKSIWQSIVQDVESILSNFINGFMTRLLNGLLSRIAGASGSFSQGVAGLVASGLGGNSGTGGVSFGGGGGSPINTGTLVNLFGGGAAGSSGSFTLGTGVATGGAGTGYLPSTSYIGTATPTSATGHAGTGAAGVGGAAAIGAGAFGAGLLGGAVAGRGGALTGEIASTVGGAALLGSGAMTASTVGGSIALGAATFGIGAAAVGVYALVKWLKGAEVRHIMQDVGTTWGAEIDKTLAKQIQQTEKTIEGFTKNQRRQFAEALNADALEQAAGSINADNVQKFERNILPLFDMVKKGGKDAEMATGVLNDQIGKFVAQAEQTGSAWDPVLKQLIQQSKDLGLNLDSINQAIDAQIQKLGGGLSKLVSGAFAGTNQQIGKIAQGLSNQGFSADQIASLSNPDAAKKTLKDLNDSGEGSKAHQFEAAIASVTALSDGAQTSFDRLSRIALASFNSIVAGGKSAFDAVGTLGDSIDQLIAEHDQLGLKGGAAYDQLARLRTLTKDNQGLIDSVSGLNDTLTALANLGGLDADTFADLEAQGVDAFNQMTAAGFTQQEAEQALVPFLQNIIDLHAQTGLAIDDETQKLIDQAEQDGVLKAKQISTNQILIDGIGALIKSVGGDLPDSFKTFAEQAKKSTDEVSDEVKKRNKESKDNTKDTTAQMQQDFETWKKTSIGHVRDVEGEIRGGLSDAVSRIQIDPIRIPYTFDPTNTLPDGGTVPGGTVPGGTGRGAPGASIGALVTTTGLRYLAAGGLSDEAFPPKGTDTVHAMLTPGEGVLNVDAMHALGLEAFAALNKGLSLDQVIWKSPSLTLPTLMDASLFAPPRVASAGGFAAGDTKAPQVTVNFNAPVYAEQQYIKDNVLPTIISAVKQNYRGSGTRMRSAVRAS